MPAGRPTDLTPEVIRRLEGALRTCLYLETAASFAGVSRIAFRMWIRRGAKEEKRLIRNPRSRPKASEAVYLELFNLLKKALADAEILAIGRIVCASEDITNPETGSVSRGEWQAAAWLLERRFPERWSRDRSVIREMQKQIAELEKERAARGARRPKPSESDHAGQLPPANATEDAPAGESQ